MKAIDKLIDRLPLPAIIAVAIIVVTAWLFKVLGEHNDYGPVLANRKFIGIAILAALGVPAYYLLERVWSNRRLLSAATSPGLTGIWIARFIDDTSSTVQKSLVEELRHYLLPKSNDIVHIEIKYLNRAISGATAADQYKLATELGKKINASIVIWGNVIGKKQFVHLTIIRPITGGPQQIDISPLIADLSEVTLPDHLVKNIKDLSNYIAAATVLQGYESGNIKKDDRKLLQNGIDLLREISLSKEPDLKGMERQFAASVKFLEGYLNFYLDRYEAASDAFEQIRLLDKKIGVAANTFLGLTAFHQGQPWQKVLDYLLNGYDSPLTWYAIGKLMFTAKEFEAARRAFVLVLRRDRTNAYAHYYKARLFGIEKDYAKAFGSINKAIRYFNRSKDERGAALAYRILGELYDETGKTKKAMKAFLAATQRDPTDSFTLNYLGTIHARRGNSSDSLRYYNAAIEADPSNHRAYFNLGGLYAATNEVEKAVQMYEKAGALCQDYLQPYYQLVKLHTRVENYDKAIESYEEFLKRVELESFSEEEKTWFKQDLQADIESLKHLSS